MPLQPKPLDGCCRWGIEGGGDTPLTPQGSCTSSPTRFPHRHCLQQGSLVHCFRQGRKNKEEIPFAALCVPLCCALGCAHPLLSCLGRAGVGVSLPATQQLQLTLQNDLAVAVRMPTLFLKHQSRSQRHQAERWESLQKTAHASKVRQLCQEENLSYSYIPRKKLPLKLFSSLST